MDDASPDPEAPQGLDDDALADGFQELRFDAEEAHDADPFMEAFRGMPDDEDAGGARQNPFLRVAYGRRLLDQDQERELGRRLADARIAMTEALAAFGPCVGYLCAQWERAVVNERAPGEVLQWPSGESSAQRTGEERDAGDGVGQTRARMARLALRHARWREQAAGGPALETSLDLRAGFVDAAPAFNMLCELKEVARASLARAPARFKGRAGLERALQQAAAAEMRFQDARRVMLESNLRLVFSISGKFVNNGVGYDDLVQEGCIGLLRAIEKFDASLGFKFSTYASTWIWQAVTRAIANQRRTVRVPAHIHDKMIRVRGLAARFHQRTGREPTLKELAAESGLHDEVVTRALNAANRSLSLDAPVRAGEELSFVEMTPDASAEDAEDVVERSQLAAIIGRELGALPEREAVILSLRLGLGGAQAHTLEEIGEILGITRERTRQLQNRALVTLRGRLKEVGVALT